MEGSETWTRRKRIYVVTGDVGLKDPVSGPLLSLTVHFDSVKSTSTVFTNSSSMTTVRFVKKNKKTLFPW